MEYIVTFHTHFDALQYDRFLKKNNIKGRLQPVPRKLSSSCGTCIKFEIDKEISFSDMFLHMEHDKIYQIDNKKNIKVLHNKG